MISNPVATRRAYLVWQDPPGSGPSRSAMPVAELTQLKGRVSFRYLDEEHLAKPRERGFDGYFGLPIGSRDNDRRAMKLLRHRLPPRSRTDFGDMLRRFGLPADWDHTDLSLLAYTGARRPGNRFSVCETFDGFDEPFTYVFDLAGVRHCRDACEGLSPGDPLTFECERDSDRDSDAIRVTSARNGATVGYVNCVQADVVRRWLNDGQINSSMFRFNGRPGYPRLFVRADIVPPAASSDEILPTADSMAA